MSIEALNRGPCLLSETELELPQRETVVCFLQGWLQPSSLARAVAYYPASGDNDGETII